MIKYEDFRSGGGAAVEGEGVGGVAGGGDLEEANAIDGEGENILAINGDGFCSGGIPAEGGGGSRGDAGFKCAEGIDGGWLGKEGCLLGEDGAAFDDDAVGDGVIIDGRADEVVAGADGVDEFAG